MHRLAHTARTACAYVVLGVFDLSALLLCAAIASSAFAAPAFAYVDPSVMTYTIQALAGVAVALSAVAGVAFRRSRKAIMKALGIDADARKQRDYPFKRLSANEGNLAKDAISFMSDADMAAQVKGQRSKRKAVSGTVKQRRKESVVRRIVLAILVAVFFSLTVVIMPPYETMAGSQSSVIFGLEDVWEPLAIEALIVAAVLAVILPFLRGAVFNVVFMMLFSFTVCCYVQAMFLNTGMPSTDGRMPDWYWFKTTTAISAAVWLVIMVVPFELSRWKRTIVQTVAGAVAACLIVVQGVAAVNLVGEAQSRPPLPEGEVPASQYIMSTNDLYTVSPGKNVIFFVLDTFDTSDMIQIMQTEPELADRLTGFTWFRNSAGAMSPTRYGVPYLLTGEYPSEDEPFERYVAERYKRSDYLPQIQDAGYSIGIYSDTLGDYIMSDEDRRALIFDKTVNIVAPKNEEEAPQVDRDSMLKMMVRVSAYRDLLWLAKPFAYFTTDQLNRALAGWDESEEDARDEQGEPHDESGAALRPYVMDDAAWFRNLKREGLSFENREDTGAFRFIHMEGTHAPYVVNEWGETDPDSSVEQQARGSLRMVEYYLDQMKELGVYEDATIIITADHGIWWESKPGPLPWISSPLMLVKPSGASDEPFVQDYQSEIAPRDALATVVDAIGGNTQEWGPTIFEQDEYFRDRRYMLTHTWADVDSELVEYRIIGNVLSQVSWEPTGVVWDPSNTPR